MSRQEMDTAPLDGTWIIGIDKDGREARIQSRQTHPAVPGLRHWGEGETEMQGGGNWEVSKCFYPVAWKPSNDQTILPQTEKGS
jgi:hypothetical protein